MIRDNPDLKRAEDILRQASEIGGYFTTRRAHEEGEAVWLRQKIAVYGSIKSIDRC